eukprot:396257_1
MGNDKSSLYHKSATILGINRKSRDKNKNANSTNTNQQEPNKENSIIKTSSDIKQYNIKLSTPSVEISHASISITTTNSPQYYVYNNKNALSTPNKKHENQHLYPPQNPITLTVNSNSDSDIEYSHHGFNSYSVSLTLSKTYEHDEDMINIDTNNEHIKINKMRNGITNKYVSLSMVQIVHEFWINNIDKLTTQSKIELGCAIYFELIQMDNI